MYTNLPHNIDKKVDSPKRLSLLSGVPKEYFTDASDFNKILDALTELYNYQKASETSQSNTLKFHNAAGGVVHGSAGAITQNLIIDPANAVEGGMVEVIWTGSVNPNITGVAAADILNIGQTITENATYSIFIMRTGGKYRVNITPKNTQYVGADGGVDPSGETLATITVTDPTETLATITVT